MYAGWFFCFKRRDVWNHVEKSRDVLLVALQTLTSLLYFFLLEKSSWLLYIVIMLMMTMITYLLAVQGALLPACVCMKGVMMYDRMEEDDMKRTLEACYCYNVECFFFFLVHERFTRSMCACLLLNTYLLQSGTWIDVNPTACVWENECVFVHIYVLDCVNIVMAIKFKNIGTIAYVS